MTGRHPYKFLILITVGILLFSAVGSGACAKQATTIPATEPKPTVSEEMPAVTEEKTVPPETKVVTEEKTAPSEAGAVTAEKPTATPAPTLSPEPAIEPELTSLKVDISDFAFVPATVTVPVGATITWTNKDSAAHTVSSQDNLFDSGNLPRGSAFSYTFPQEGAFLYYCAIHPSMSGKVVVGKAEATPAGQGTTTNVTGGLYYD